MRTVQYQVLLDGVLKMRGEDPANALLQSKLAMAEFLNQALSDCWEYWRWPELGACEARRFRPDWVAGSYPTNTELWDPTTSAYYRATAPVTAADVPGTSLNWLELSTFNRYVDYQQTGATPIEAVLKAWDKDPRANTDAKELYFTVNEQGVRFAADAVDTVWIEFRTRCPDFSWSGIWSAATYASGKIVYHADTGEVYQANQTCTQTDVPGASGKWDLRSVPYIFRHAAKWKAYALWLLSDGQADKALAFDNNDTANPGKFQDALEEQVWQYTKLQGQTGRVNTLVLGR